jgi:hypothetical protein
VAQFSNNFWLSVFQLCCKIRIIEAQSGAPGNRTPLITRILTFKRKKVKKLTTNITTNNYE